MTGLHTVSLTDEYDKLLLQTTGNKELRPLRNMAGGFKNYTLGRTNEEVWFGFLVLYYTSIPSSENMFNIRHFSVPFAQIAH